jgi:hypothetical protein
LEALIVSVCSPYTVVIAVSNPVNKTISSENVLAVIIVVITFLVVLTVVNDGSLVLTFLILFCDFIIVMIFDLNILTVPDL